MQNAGFHFVPFPSKSLLHIVDRSLRSKVNIDCFPDGGLIQRYHRVLADAALVRGSSVHSF